jgi:hypothetical protein
MGSCGVFPQVVEFGNGKNPEIQALGAIQRSRNTDVRGD